jgi:hypothetical protein
VKAEFTVTIEGRWWEGEKRVTAAQAEKMLRQAVRDQFQFLADYTSVKRVRAATKSAAAPQPSTPSKDGEEQQ